MTLELIEAAGLLGFDAARGWPATFTHDKTARLQSWRKGMERKAHRLEATTWTKLIRLALASELAHQTTTKLVQNDDHLFAPIPFFASDEWYSRDFDDGQTRQVNARAPSRTETHHHITAPDFAAWLATQDMEPSPHIAAWFKAQGVGNTAPKSVPAPQAAPLAIETPRERRARLLDLFEAEEKRGKRGALQRLADREGIDRSNMRKDIEKARTLRAEQKRAGAQLYVQLVQSGKRTN